MKTTLRVLLVTMIGFALLVAAGCATQKMPQSGFLTDYSLMRVGDPKLGVAEWQYVNESAVIGAYDKVMLDHVVFYLKEEADYKGIHSDELQELSEAFHQAVVEALSGPYTFTDKAGPGVMRIRLAITDVVPTKRGLGTVATILPIGAAINIVKKGAGGSATGLGQVSFEGEVLDAQTNKVLGAAIDRGAGKAYRLDKTVTKWGHHKVIFEEWAQSLRQRLDKLVGRQ
jgi:hypothetical protein